ncbi:MAG: hypothetical protein HYY52_05240 [Candidatus Melainabacteria bacterium]|nr:hypothetical protein [Candidatus Melainabacteria bacterium]
MSTIPRPLPTGSNTSENPTQRLSEIRSKIFSAETRLQDLEALYSATLLEQPLLPGNGVTIDGEDWFGVAIRIGVGNDLNRVRDELGKTQEYLGILRTQENLWVTALSENKKLEKETQKAVEKA